MFGYVVPLKDELRIREFEVFRSYYCGLCNEIGKKSYISKVTLTYDMTFLSLLLSSIYLDTDITYKKFCPYKFNRVNIVNTNKYIEYAAHMNIILSNRKLIDNFKDDKSYVSLIFSKIISSKNITSDIESKIKTIDNYLLNTHKLEREKCSSLDEISHDFAKICEEIFDIHGNSAPLRVLGYNIGKWIYILDAFDDIEKDVKKGNYNPLLYRFNYKTSEDVKSFKSRIIDNIEFTLIRCLSEASSAFDLIDIKKNKDILDNIIYLGLDRQTTKVLRGGCCSEKSVRSIRA
ncbi:DUF5685 family protein [Clostridium cylindrosporum]|uniref:Uncharacterized protein n=1 Tax=Clostridium cylindrosporum DSM 605 TaxID=1121307 RepID=A0A0J8D929_CLOCY|nr:DUF5685 family protein [Clostridium cylindrosporum]KMT20854.1 hypothetical protein CLCY_1c00880 [Clostridium cylindrosporum DSM 605]